MSDLGVGGDAFGAPSRRGRPRYMGGIASEECASTCCRGMNSDVMEFCFHHGSQEQAPRADENVWADSCASRNDRGRTGFLTEGDGVSADQGWLVNAWCRAVLTTSWL